MLTRRFVLGAALAAALASPALAHDYQLGALKIGHPWARATVAATGGAFLSVDNTGAAPDRLLRASTARAGKVELHTHIKDGDVMRMRAVEAIDLPPGQKVTLQPGGYHIMLFDLKQPLKEGERVPLTLEFEKAGRITVEIAVDKAGAMGGHHKH
ncbi:MAG: copper chaperone PCu(A)C [Reyranellaceae bacterium]